MEEKLAERPLKIPRVPCSSKWMSKLSSEGFSNAGAPADQNSDKESIFNMPKAFGSEMNEEKLVLATNKAYDWTFSSDYCCTVSESDSSSAEMHTNYSRILGARELSSQAKSSSSSSWQIAHEAQSGIDMDLLRQRDVPILFYDEFILYQVRKNEYMCTMYTVCVHVYCVHDAQLS